MLLSLCVPMAVSAAGPTGMVYEGFLRNSAGLAQSGTAPITVRVYDDQTGGSLIYEELHPAIVIAEGYFSVPVGSIGDVNGGTAVTAFSKLSFSTNYFITTEIGVPFNTGEMTLAGGLRAPITLAPYAYSARSLPSFAVAPSGSLNSGEVYYDSATQSVYVYNGVSWIALNGANSIQSSDVVDGSLTVDDLASSSVDSAKILDSTIAGIDILDSAITSAKIFDGTISLADLAADSVDSSKILDGSVANSDLAQSTIGMLYDTVGTDISVGGSPAALGGALTLSIPTASASARGALSAADWSSFNSKEPQVVAGTSSQFYRGDKTWVTLDTAAVPESTNLYYTQGRFDAAFSAKTTDNLLQGLTNKFYAPSLFDLDFAGKNTTSLAEGSNLYYTDARARGALSAGSGLNYNSISGLFGLDRAVANNWTGLNTFAQSGGVGLLPFGVGAGQTTELRFSELSANGSSYVGFKSPDALASSTVWSLPSADGITGQVLSTDGAGSLSWTSSGSASGAAGALQFSNGSGALNSNASNIFWDNTNSRLGIGTSSPAQKLDISNGHVQQFWTGGNPTYYIGDSSGVSQYGFIAWDSAADLLKLGTQGGGNTLRLSNFNRVGINADPTTTDRLTLLASNTDNNVLRLRRNENSGSGLGFTTFRRGDGTELGYITCNLTGLTCGLFNASDIRVKESIVNTSKGLETLMSIGVHDYHVKGDVADNIQQGFIAQDLYNVYPQAVTRGDDSSTLTPEGKMWGVDYGRITPLLVRAIQEQQVLINGSVYALLASAEDISNVKTEVPRDVDDVFAGRAAGGTRTIADFVSARITALRGYFDTIITRESVAETSTSQQLCVGSQQDRTCLDKERLDSLLNLVPVSSALPVAPVPTAGSGTPLPVEAAEEALEEHTIIEGDVPLVQEEHSVIDESAVGPVGGVIVEIPSEDNPPETVAADPVVITENTAVADAGEAE
jgi:hypothetical protein